MRSPREVASDNRSPSKFFALCRVCGFSTRRSEPARSTGQIQMLSRPVLGWLAALQSTMTKVSNIPGSAMLVRMIIVVVVIAAAHVMVMRLLREPNLGLVADDLRAVFAQLAVHVRVAAVDF